MTTTRSEGNTLNVWSVAALGIGSMVGAGIFALLGQAALVAGGQTYLAFLIGGVVALLSGYSYAKLAARYPEGSGISAYFDAAFGVGRVSGTLTLLYLVTLAVTIAMVGSTFGAVNFPQVQLPVRPIGTRFIHVHRNVPGVLRQVNDAVSRHGINILAQYLQTDPEVGYVVLETDVVGGEGEELLADLKAVAGTIRVRVLYDQGR